MTLASRLPPFSASIDRHRDSPSTWSLVSSVPRSRPPHSACSGIARFSCSGSCRQWRPQQCEVVSFRGCGGSRTPPFRMSGGASRGPPRLATKSKVVVHESSKILKITVNSGQLVVAQTKRSASAVLTQEEQQCMS